MVDEAKTAGAGPSLDAPGERERGQPAASVRPKYELGWPALFLCAMYLIAMLVLTLMSEERPLTAMKVAGVMGACAVLFLFPLGLGWAVFRLTRRSNRVGNIVVIAFTAVVTLGSVGAYLNAGLQPETMRELRRIDEITRAVVGASGAGDAAKTVEYRQRFDAAWDDLVDRAPWKDRAAVRGLRALNEELVRLANASHQAFHKYVPVSDVTIASPGVTMAERVRLLEDAMKVQSEWLNFLQNYDARIVHHMEQEGVRSSVIGSFRQRAADLGVIARTAEVQEIQRHILKISYDKFQILHEYEGEWWVNHERNVDVSTNVPQDAIDQLNAIGKRYQELVLEKRRAQGTQAGEDGE